MQLFWSPQQSLCHLSPFLLPRGDPDEDQDRACCTRLLCESAPRPDPTSDRSQLIDILKEILFRVGSYPNRAEAKEVTAAQIPAHNPSDKSNTAITDPSLLSRRLRPRVPSGRTVGRSSVGCAPPNRTLLPTISSNPEYAPVFFNPIATFTLILRASKKRPSWHWHGGHDQMDFHPTPVALQSGWHGSSPFYRTETLPQC